MIAWGLRIHVSPGKRDEVHRIFRSLLEPTRVRGGCLACRAYQDTEEPEVLALIQEWASWDALEHYLRSEAFRRVVAVMDLASKQVQILTDSHKDESPSFAPNGRMILIATEMGGRGVLSAVSIDGRIKQRLSISAGDVREPAWGPFSK